MDLVLRLHPPSVLRKPVDESSGSLSPCSQAGLLPISKFLIPSGHTGPELSPFPSPGAGGLVVGQLCVNPTEVE